MYSFVEVYLRCETYERKETAYLDYILGLLAMAIKF